MLFPTARKIVVAVVGSTVVLVGVVLMVTPGPGLLVVLGGLAILATEFVWARSFLRRVKDRAQRTMSRVRGGASPTDTAPPAGAPRDITAGIECDANTVERASPPA